MCYMYDQEILANCASKNLDTLPTFMETDAMLIKQIFLNKNNITNLDKSIIESWKSLEEIDVRNNPINCAELEQIPEHISVTSDCHIRGKSDFITPTFFLKFYIFFSDDSSGDGIKISFIQ